jgi:hypothetical protein
LVDAIASGAIERKLVRVRIPPLAQKHKNYSVFQNIN